MLLVQLERATALDSAKESLRLNPSIGNQTSFSWGVVLEIGSHFSIVRVRPLAASEGDSASRGNAAIT